MSEMCIRDSITATPAARKAITALHAARGGPVMFVQSGGCCAGSTPMCFPFGEFLIGDVDVLLGDIDGSPFYIDKRLDEAWNQDEFLLDVAEGEPEDFSLAAGENPHFVTLSPPSSEGDRTLDTSPRRNEARRLFRRLEDRIKSLPIHSAQCRTGNLGQRPSESEASGATRSCLQVTSSKADAFDPS